MQKYIIFFILFFTISACAKEFIFPQVYDVEDIRGSLDPLNRLSSYPYISGDSFRKICDFTIDEASRSFDPDLVKPGDVIFLHNHVKMLDFFFCNIHPQIKATYILVTHNGDKSYFDSYLKYLDDDAIFAWLGVNLTIKHKKALPLPIGMANKHYDYGNTGILNGFVEKMPHKKDILLYMNFSVGTNDEMRGYVKNIFSKKAFCYNVIGRKNYDEYICDVARSKFILSPEGNGIDCYRTWEAMLLGGIPIIPTTALDSLFKELPVIIVDDWNKVTKEFLIKKYEEMISKKYKMEKLYMDYWIDKINILKEKAKV